MITASLAFLCWAILTSNLSSVWFFRVSLIVMVYYTGQTGLSFLTDLYAPPIRIVVITIGVFLISAYHYRLPSVDPRLYRS